VSPDSDDYLNDPCLTHVQMKHAAGCAEVNFVWGRRAVGAFFIFIGVLLTLMNIRYIKWFMATIIQFTVLAVLLAMFGSMGYLAIVDPQEPERRKSVLNGVIALVVALVAMLVARWAFRKFLRFGATFIGMGAGYMVTIYTILAINGFCSVFQARNAASVIGEDAQMLYALAGIIVGSYIGYNYAFIFIMCVQCFVSAYLVVRGCSLWINYGFPDEVSLIERAYG